MQGLKGDYSDAWKKFARHCADAIYHIEGICVYQYYGTVERIYSFRINISIADVYRISTRIVYVRNFF